MDEVALFEYLDYIYHLTGVSINYGAVCYFKDYTKLAKMIPKDKIVVDIGCSFGIQQILFKEHKKYIGIQKFREGNNCDVGFKPFFKILTDNAEIIEGDFKDVWHKIGITEENRDDFFGIANHSIFHDLEKNKESIEIFQRLFPKNYYATDETGNMKYHYHRRLIIEELEGMEFESILEAGCGIGGNMEWIVEKFPNVKKYACELKEGNLETAINNFPQIEFRKCNIISLPYPDKSIDVVLSDMVIYYLEGEDILKAISEMKRVAKKMIIISEETGKILSYIPKEMKVIKHDWDCPSKVEGEGIRFIATLKYGNKKGNNLEQLTEFLQ